MSGGVRGEFLSVFLLKYCLINSREMGWSAYGLFGARSYHFEPN